MKNKRVLGISVYPEKSSKLVVENYIKLAAKYGFSRLYLSLLQIELNTKEKMLKTYMETIKYAQNLGFEVVVDVSPRAYKTLEIELPDLSFFHKIGADRVRFDAHGDGFLEKQAINNRYGIKLEFNMSQFKTLAGFLAEFDIPTKDIITSHNFYPQKYTGLNLEYFVDLAKEYKSHGYRTAAYISSPNGEIGPWPINDGLPSLEIHRNLPILTQAKHLFALNVIDDLIISNSFATEQELKELSELNPNKIELDVKTLPIISAVERKILFDYDHHYRRGDINDYIVRSTWTRVYYKTSSIPAISNKGDQKFGDIYVGNNSFFNYKGEMHLVLKEMPLDKRKNKVAEIVEHEKFLVKYIGPWKGFKLREVK